MTQSTKNIVLVHGGFVDGSGWESVYSQMRLPRLSNKLHRELLRQPQRAELRNCFRKSNGVDG